MGINLKSHVGIKGKVRVLSYKATWFSRFVPPRVMIAINKYRTPIADTGWSQNLVMNGTNTGVNLIAQALAGFITDIGITTGKFGTDATPPTPADTDVGADPQPMDLTFAEVDGASVTLYFFYPSALLDNDTYFEYALFCGANIFSRVLVKVGIGFAKATNQDTQVIYQIDLEP